MQGRELIQAFKGKGYTFDREFLPYDLDVSRYLRRHDIVFKSPQMEGFEGLPLGNGDISLMMWSVGEGLRMQLNKNDTWTQPDEEAPMLLRSCGRVNIDFGQPCNDLLYLDDFEARLSIGEAKVGYRTSTPFCTIQAEAFVDTETNLVVIDLSYETLSSDVEPVVRISLERYGSRAFPYWYSGMVRGAKTGLGNVRADVAGESITIVESFDDVSGLRVASAARLIGQNCPAKTVNEKRSEIEWRVKSTKKVTLLIAVASSGDHGNVAAKALGILENAENTLDLIRARQGQWWREFWNRSFLSVSRQDSEADYDYMENLYYMQLYAMGSASRGNYPMIFNGGAYTWNRDTRQWVNPHHWNIQQSYWSMDACNRPELLEPYFKTYSRMIPAARKFTRDNKRVFRGMAISEMHDFSGRMLSYHGALTPASQIAQQYWNHYLYNQDVAFLRDSAYPFIKECADFYAEYASLNEKTGKYEIGPAAVYECEFGESFKNTVVDMTMVRYILPVAMKAAETLETDGDRVQKWKAVLEDISDFVYFDGQDNETLAMGLDRDGKKADFKLQNMTFCRNTSPLMPCPIIGLKDRDTRLFKAVYNAALKYTRNQLAITPISVVWARLGEGARAMELLFDSIAQLQHFPQGFFYNIDHWYQYSRYAKRVDDYLTECQRDYIYDRTLEYSGIKVRNGTDSETVDMPTQPFVQAGFEPAGILVHALNEMMLQCHEGVVRLLPAWPEGSRCDFTLKAAGNFIVSGSAGKEGVRPYMIIKSLSGGACSLAVPFMGRGVRICNAKGRDQHFDVTQKGYVRFMTAIAETYLVYAADLGMDEVQNCGWDFRVNTGHKNYRQATLGRKRMF